MLATPRRSFPVSLALVLGLLLGSTLTGIAFAAYQPHMIAALSSLRVARGQLEVAVHNKGGHRVRAIALVNAAIKQVNIGIRVGNR